jgi:alkanesulfonate monooxygenase SsuD/methylene tetrahydromethanopterin reductase-like flavin-dependent oxidoreductase (luciferase family)
MTADEADSGRIRFGILPSPNFTTWADLRDVAVRIDQLGYDALWCSDHLYAPDPVNLGPVFEGYTTLSAFAALTERVTLGLMVGCNNFRNPALTVKMATTLDHISNGRAVLSLGAGWFEGEHLAFGAPFGPPKERLDRLEESLQIITALLDGEEANGHTAYTNRAVKNMPMPVQRRLPLLVGGGGEKRTLRIVAQYADIWNIAGFYDDVARKLEVLHGYCAEIGRDPSTIGLHYHGGPMFIRDDMEDAIELTERTLLHHGVTGVYPPLMGTVQDVVSFLEPIARLGFTEMYFDCLTPYDDESLVRMVEEVRPALEKAVASTATSAVAGA